MFIIFYYYQLFIKNPKKNSKIIKQILNHKYHKYVWLGIHNIHLKLLAFLNSLIYFLGWRRICRSSGQQVVYNEMPGQYRQLFARLAKENNNI